MNFLIPRIAAALITAFLLTDITAALAGTCEPSPAGLVSSWQAEGDFTDCLGINDGTQVGVVPFAPGKVGQAFSFVADPSNYVNLGNPASLKFTDAVTITAWVYPTAPPEPSNLRAILTKWGQQFQTNPPPQPGDDSYGLWLENGTAGTLQVFGAVNLDPGGPGTIEPHVDGGMIPLDAWSHVAMTFFRSPTETNLAVYVNCTNVASAAVGDFPIIASDKQVLIGREDSYQTRAFAGLIDQVRVFDRALTAEEISQLVLDTDPVACDPITPAARKSWGQLKARWKHRAR